MIKKLIFSLSIIAISVGLSLSIQSYLHSREPEIGSGEQLLGTSITTIQPTDKISDSRTTINNNFTALNTGKLEVSGGTMTGALTINDDLIVSQNATTTGVHNIGELKINDNYTFPTSDGTANYVLKTNGSGVLSWQADNTGSTIHNWLFNGSYLYPSSTVGFIVSASSTIQANFRVDGNATTTGSHYIGGDLNVVGDMGIADADVPDTITASNYLLLTGGALTGAASSTFFHIANDLTVAGGVSLPANSITDAMVSNTLTASDLVAGSAVVDISTETNLTAGDHITLTDDDLDIDDAFVLNTTDTMTGGLTMVYSITTGTMTIPQGASITTTNAGEIGNDTTSDTLRYGASNRVLPYWNEKCFTMASTTWATGLVNIPLWHPAKAIEVTDVYCETDGGTSIITTFSDGTNALEGVTCDEDGAADDGSIANGTFTANERFEVDLSSVTGAVNYLNACITYSITAD